MRLAQPILRTRCPPSRADAGFVTLVILILVFLMVALVMANARILAHMKADLQRVELRQMGRTQTTVSKEVAESGDEAAPPAEGAQP